MGEAPRPVHPIRPSAPASKSTVLPEGVGIWNQKTGSAYYKEYPPLPQQTKPAPMHDPVPHQELQEVRNEVKKMGLLVENFRREVALV